MYLLDTNIVSLLDPPRRLHTPQLIDWLERNGAVLFLSAITLAELETGVVKLRREGQHERADQLTEFVDSTEREFAERILPVDGTIARRLPEIGARIFPQNIGWPDLIIAATADVHGLTVLTRNVRRFEPTGNRVVDPLAQIPPDRA